MPSLVVGDVVDIKSGGPLMTVEVMAATSAVCVWFVEKELRREEFQLAALRKRHQDQEYMS